MTTPPVPSRSDGVNYLYMAAAFVVVAAGMRAAESILNPLLLAIFLSVMCAPPYAALLRRGVSQWLALLIVTGVLSAVTFGLLAVLMDSITGFTARHDHYIDRVDERRREIRQHIQAWLPETKDDEANEHANGPDELESGEPHADEVESPDAAPPAADVPADDGAESEAVPDVASVPAASDDTHQEEATLGDEALDEELLDGESGDDEFPTDMIVAAPPAAPIVPETGGSWTDLVYSQFDPRTVISLMGRMAGSIGVLLSNGLLIGLTVIFILLEAGSFRAKLAKAFSDHDDTSQKADQIVSSVQRYMLIKTGMSLATAVLIAIWLRIFGVPYVALWALLAFLLNYIPNVGSFIAAVPAVLIAWLDLGTLPAIGCIVGYAVVNVGIGNFLEPRIMGRGLGLSPLVIFCSMIFWGWVLGPVGMLLSVPLTMTAHIVLNGFDDTRWIATLMGTTGSTE